MRSLIKLEFGWSLELTCQKAFVLTQFAAFQVEREYSVLDNRKALLVLVRPTGFLTHVDPCHINNTLFEHIQNEPW